MSKCWLYILSWITWNILYMILVLYGFESKTLYGTNTHILHVLVWMLHPFIQEYSVHEIAGIGHSNKNVRAGMSVLNQPLKNSKFSNYLHGIPISKPGKVFDHLPMKLEKSRGHHPRNFSSMDIPSPSYVLALFNYRWNIWPLCTINIMQWMNMVWASLEWTAVLNGKINTVYIEDYI